MKNSEDELDFDILIINGIKMNEKLWELITRKFEGHRFLFKFKNGVEFSYERREALTKELRNPYFFNNNKESDKKYGDEIILYTCDLVPPNKTFSIPSLEKFSDIFDSEILQEYLNFETFRLYDIKLLLLGEGQTKVVPSMVLQKKYTEPKYFVDLLQCQHLCIGEAHCDVAARLFFLENMYSLKEKGFETLFIEGIPYDIMQDELDKFMLLENDLFPIRLGHYLDEFESFSNKVKLIEVIKEAKKNGIRVVGLEISAFLMDTEKVGSEESEEENSLHNIRHEVFNSVASEIIMRESGNKKSISLTGSHHIAYTNKKGIKDFLANLDCKTVSILSESSKYLSSLSRHIDFIFECKEGQNLSLENKEKTSWVDLTRSKEKEAKENCGGI